MTPAHSNPATLPDGPNEIPVRQDSRLAFLDWTRGLAALIMLNGHVFHAYFNKSQRDSGHYTLSQFLGGMPPAIFLFLTGVTLAFLMNGNERRQLPFLARIRAAFYRARYLILIAFAVRIQLYLFSLPESNWQDIFKVDILNLMGLGVILLSPLALFNTLERVKYGILTGVAIAAAAPVVSMIDWTGVPWLFRQYLVPDPNFFPIFPWGAFLAFGLAFGSLVRLVKSQDLDRAMLWAGLAGFVMIFTARYMSDIPWGIYPKSEFWLDSPELIFCKLGVILLTLAFAWQWTKLSPGQWSWVRQLGATSLLVYWLHIEIVYGRWFGQYKESLSLQATVLASVVLIASMVGISLLRTRWRAILELVSPSVQPASGD